MSEIYKHFKGNLYTKLLECRSATNTGVPEDLMVVYVSLKTGEIWCRPLAEFEMHVMWPDGQTRPRFMKVGE